MANYLVQQDGTSHILLSGAGADALLTSATGVTVTAAIPATNNGSVTSGSITTVGGAGSLLMIFVQSRSPGNTPTDSKSNTWTALSAEQAISISGTTYYLRAWKCKAGTGGTLHTATSTNSGTPSGFQTIHFMELLGGAGLDIDQAISWNVDTTATYNSNSVTASVAGLALSFNSIFSTSAGSSITHSGDGFTSTASSYMNGSAGPCSEIVYQTSAATTAYQDAVSATSPASDVAFGIFTVGVSSAVTVALTGVTATGSQGTVAVALSKALTSVSSTASVGTVSVATANTVNAKSWAGTLVSGRYYSDISHSVTNPTSVGPLTPATPYTTGLTGGNGTVSAYNIYYPSGLSSAAPAVVFIGGNTNDINQAPVLGPTGYMEKDNYEWSYLLASYGFIVMQINPANLGDLPLTRAASLLNAADMLANENTRSGSPLFGLVQTSNMAAAGHSWGAAGAWMACADPSNSRFQAYWGINPVDNGTGNAANITVPSLFLSSYPNGSITDTSPANYASIGGTVPKILAELINSTHQTDMHNMCRAPIATTWVSSGSTVTSLHEWDHKATSLVVSFLQRYLNANTAYTQFLVTDASVVNSWSSANV